MSKIFAGDAAAWRQAVYVDLGAMGAPKECGQGNRRITFADPKARCECTHCGALLFRDEAKRAERIGAYRTAWSGGQLCCCDGAVALAPIRRDAGFEALWATHGWLLYQHARALNNAMSMSSMPVRTPPVPGGSSWRPSVCIEGKLHHKMGTLANPATGTARYAQLYVHDPNIGDKAVLRFAGQGFRSVHKIPAKAAEIKELLNKLHEALEGCNPYVQDIITAGEVCWPFFSSKPKPSTQGDGAYGEGGAYGEACGKAEHTARRSIQG